VISIMCHNVCLKAGRQIYSSADCLYIGPLCNSTLLRMQLICLDGLGLKLDAIVTLF